MNLAVSLRSHLNEATTKDLCLHVTAVSFAYPQNSAMEELKSAWMERGGMVGEGGSGKWATTIEEADPALERIKIMRASGYLVSEDDDDDDDDEDDWSAVIHDQTGETIVEREVSEDKTSSGGIESPFAKGEAKEGSNNSGSGLSFTAANVDEVLNEVRPYLVADGGNVAVSSIDVETRSVYLVLQGACGSCPSSTVTMKMGIERVLRENFGEIGEVKQVEDPNAGAKELTREIVEER